MSEINYVVSDEKEVAGMKITPEQVGAVIGLLEKLSGFGKALAKLTKTTVDDDAIVWLETAMAAVKPYATEPWFSDAINFVLGLFMKGDVEAIKAFAIK